MRIVLLSDTHCLHQKIEVPDGDVLIHAGDFTEIGMLDEVRKFNKFLATHPHPHKIVIAGNHDICFEDNLEEAKSVLKDCMLFRR